MGWADCFPVLSTYHSLLWRKRKFGEGFFWSGKWIFMVRLQLATLGTGYQGEAGRGNETLLCSRSPLGFLWRSWNEKLKFRIMVGEKVQNGRGCIGHGIQKYAVLFFMTFVSWVIINFGRSKLCPAWSIVCPQDLVPGSSCANLPCALHRRPAQGAESPAVWPALGLPNPEDWAFLLCPNSAAWPRGSSAWQSTVSGTSV